MHKEVSMAEARTAAEATRLRAPRLTFPHREQRRRGQVFTRRLHHGHSAHPPSMVHHRTRAHVHFLVLLCNERLRMSDNSRVSRNSGRNGISSNVNSMPDGRRGLTETALLKRGGVSAPWHRNAAKQARALQIGKNWGENAHASAKNAHRAENTSNVNSAHKHANADEKMSFAGAA
jgi:hypothetical protein